MTNYGVNIYSKEDTLCMKELSSCKLESPHKNLLFGHSVLKENLMSFL